MRYDDLATRSPALNPTTHLTTNTTISPFLLCRDLFTTHARKNRSRIFKPVVCLLLASITLHKRKELLHVARCALIRDPGLSMPAAPRQSVYSTDFNSEIAAMDYSLIPLPPRETETALTTFKPCLGQIFALTPVPSFVLDYKLDIVVSMSYLSLTGTKWEECVGVNIYKSISDKSPGAECDSIRHSSRWRWGQEMYILLTTFMSHPQNMPCATNSYF